MEDSEQTRSDLARELAATQRRVAELESLLAQCIGDRKRTEEQLQEIWQHHKELYEESQRTAEFYQGLLEASPDPIVVYDMDGIPSYINPAFSRVFGWTFDELEGKRIDFVPEENWPETKELVNKILRGENFCNQETRRLTKDGRILDVSISGAIFSDRTGKAAGSVIRLRDITDRKRAQEKISEQNEFLSCVLESLAHPFYVIDARTYEVVHANSATRLMYSTRKGTCYALTHGRTEPCTGSEHPCPLQLVLRNKAPAKSEHVHYDQSGDPRFFEIFAYPIVDQHGDVAQVIEYSLDVTERRRAEEQVKVNKERFEALLNATTEMACLLDAEGNFLAFNKPLVQSLGKDPDELIGKCCFDFLTQDAAAERRVQFDLVAQTRMPVRWEDRRGRSCFDISCYPVFGADRDVGGVAVFIRDISAEKRAQDALRRMNEELEQRVEERTVELKRANESLLAEIADRKRAEDALRQSEERFRTIFEAAEDSIFLKDRSLKYTHVNPAMERMLGLPASKIIGRTFEQLFGHEGSLYIRDVDTRVLGGRVIEHEQTRRIRGILKTFHEIRVPMHNSLGEIIGLCGISRDITDRKRVTPDGHVAIRHYPSGAMGITLKDAYYAACGQSIILIVGESGSGKDFLARWIHDRSRRCNGPFFAINCAAISKELAESELFGHEPGAFTGARGTKRGLLELAEGGTLLLNEIGELPLPMQAKLLTFLDTKSFVRVGGQKTISVNARILAATHRDLESEIAAGRFLQALFYRLNVLTIAVPPLRERIEDLPILLEEIMAKLAAELQLTQIPVIDPASVIAMSKYHWPGNVRELRNALERALILWDGNSPFSVPIPSVQGGHEESRHDLHVPASGNLRTITDQVKHSLCAEALRRCSGNKTAAARLLGISRDSLYQYIRQFGIETDESP